MSNKVIPKNHEVASLRLKLVEEFGQILVEEFGQILNDIKGYPTGRQGNSP